MEKIELDPVSMEKRLQQPFAVYYCNGMEFSYVIFYRTTEFYNGNGRTATEWWKPGIRLVSSPVENLFGLLCTDTLVCI